MTASSEPDLPRLHLVTDASILTRPGFAREVRALLEHGGPRIALHVRAHGLTAKPAWEAADLSARAARETGAAVVVNDRIDIALAVGSGGVQVGARSFPVATVRRIAPRIRWVGVSVHGAEEAVAAARDGADFVLAGTLYPTRSHPERAASGVEWLREIRSVAPPIVGIGGIGPERVGEVMGAGAHGVAVIRGIWDAPDPVEALDSYLRVLEETDWVR